VLNGADPIFDPASPQFIGTTVPYNPFGDYRVAIPANDATVAFATVHPKDIDTSSIGTIDLNIYSTQLFKLPAGGVGFAVGAQFRRERLIQDPDQINLEGDTVGSSPTAATNAGRKDYAIYGELSIPVFSPQNAIPGFHALDISASTRFEAFLNNDSNVLVPKFGMRWQPFDEQLTLRATWGEGFREPSLFELYSSPTSALAATSLDPETPVQFSSNPNLQPEDSRAFSGGFVYTPKYVSGLTLSVDIWDIERTGTVSQPTPQSVLQRALTGTSLPGESVIFNADGTINRINTTFVNSGQQRARGIDLGAQYQYQSPFGTFTWLTQATYLDSFIFQTTDFNRAVEVSGYTVGGMGQDGYLKWRGNSRIDWAWNGIDINWTARYTGGFHEKIFGDAAGGFLKEHWVDATWMFDCQGSYDFTFVAPVESQPVAGYSKDSKEVVRGKDGKAMETAAAQTTSYALPLWKQALNNTTITVGCDNVFGQDPPKAFGAFFGNATGYPGFLYDSLGRFVYVSLTKKF
jgi:iron complex outermembrane receptor protein